MLAGLAWCRTGNSWKKRKKKQTNPKKTIHRSTGANMLTGLWVNFTYLWSWITTPAINWENPGRFGNICIPTCCHSNLFSVPGRVEMKLVPITHWAPVVFCYSRHCQFLGVFFSLLLWNWKNNKKKTLVLLVLPSQERSRTLGDLSQRHWNLLRVSRLKLQRRLQLRTVGVTVPPDYVGRTSFCFLLDTPVRSTFFCPTAHFTNADWC